MSKSRIIVLTIILVVLAFVFFPIVRGPVYCPYGGALTMTGNDCNCIGKWYQTNTPEGIFDIVYEGMCVGYRL